MQVTEHKASNERIAFLRTYYALWIARKGKKS